MTSPLADKHDTDYITKQASFSIFRLFFFFSFVFSATKHRVQKKVILTTWRNRKLKAETKKQKNWQKGFKNKYYLFMFGLVENARNREENNGKITGRAPNTKSTQS